MKVSEVSFIFFFALLPCILGGMPGGITEMSVDDPEAIRLSQVALAKLNEGKKADEASTLVEIVKASMQIVSGTLARLTLRISQGDQNRLCSVSIWEQPWLNKTEVTFEKCDDDEAGVSKSKRSASGEVDDVSNQEGKDIQMFKDFLKKHNKTYTDGKEYKKRFRIFRANLNKIKLLRKSEQGTAQYGLTWFSDLSAKEFQIYLGLKTPDTKDDLPPAEIPDIELPDQFDWRCYNVVTPVKDQKFCGSCWAFSVTGNVEGQWAIKHGNLLSLSEQELVDCDSTDKGCEGGYMTDAYKAIMQIGGLETESDYPYTARDDTCHFSRNKAKVQLSGAVNITSDEIKMAKWLVKNGPMSVALNANPMQFYFGGIAHPLKFLCNPQDLNHGVLIVGFGVHHSSILKRTVPFWIIKNSWGHSWGEKGYYRLYRGDGSCGINQMVSSAIVD